MVDMRSRFLFGLGWTVFAVGAALGQHSYLDSYLGFDRTGYPGDDLLPALHRTFAYTGYWLNDPPGLKSNPWAGKRAAVREAGFGFALLFNGRLDQELRGKDAAAIGVADGDLAAAAAAREGFPAHAVIFLDQEEGGRLLPEQAAYLGAWFAEVAKRGFRAGIYCPGIAVPDGKSTISTAQDVRARFPGVKLWVAEDQCPPAPGCVMRSAPPAKSGFSEAFIWQFAQSPRSRFAAGCGQSYAADGNCYAPGVVQSARSFLDLNASSSSDPSAGR
jgi:hypothetical protein